MESYLDLRRPLGLGVVPLRIQLSSKASKIIIGRGSKADVFLYAGEHPSFVSREHAKLELLTDSNKWTISDLDSVNGMFFNSVKLGRDEKAVLSPGDRVYFGNPQHSFFVEYEFVSAPKRCPSPSMQSDGSSALDYGSDTSSASSASPGFDPLTASSATPSPLVVRPSTSSSAIQRVHTRRRVHGNHAVATSTCIEIPNGAFLSHEEVPDDIWSCRIFKFLDMKELHAAGWTSRQWMRRAGACLDMLDTIRWKHPWSVDSLIQVLQKKLQRGGHPVTAIITEGCYKVRDDHVERLARLCSEKLTHIDFSGTPTVTSKGMRVIAKHCPNVKTLVLRGCKRVGGGSWEWMDDLAKNGTLEYCDLHCAGSNDAVVTKLANTSPLLKRVDLGVMCTEGVSDLGLFELTEKCLMLEHVDLRGCKRITDQGVSLLIQRCGPRLKTLVLHSCDIGNEAVKSIGQYCSSLEVLDVHRCTKIDDEGIFDLVLGEATVGLTLKQLDLSNLTITDAALGHLAKSTTKLASLDLRSCKYITGVGLAPLIKSISKTLQKLDLNGCSKLRPIDVFAIAQSCVGVLQELEIGAREDECQSWAKPDVQHVRSILQGRTRVHDAFDFPVRSKPVV